MRTSCFLFCTLWVAVYIVDATEFFGYTPVSSVEVFHEEIGDALKDLSGSVNEDNPNYADAMEIYSTPGSAGVSLRTVGLHFADLAPQPDLAQYVSYWGSKTYAADFVDSALTGAWASLESKPRAELSTKGAALQSVMAGVFTALRGAIAECRAGNVNMTTGAPHLVDTAWAAFAASKAPIALGEKRCPQFGTCTTNGPAGKSVVNVKLLAAFRILQTKAILSECDELQQLVESIVIPQLFVPVIQGMLRESWEVFSSEDGADGFDEVCEGWAFTAALLPRVAACSRAAATMLQTKMDTIDARGASNVRVNDAADVIAAVESVYGCLGVTCADVSAMLDRPGDGGTKNDFSYLWEPCEDGKPLRNAADIKAGRRHGVIVNDVGEDNGKDDSFTAYKVATYFLTVVCVVLVLTILYAVSEKRRYAAMAKGMATAKEPGLALI